MAGIGRAAGRAAVLGAFIGCLVVFTWPSATSGTTFGFKCLGERTDGRFLGDGRNTKIVGTPRDDVILADSGWNKIYGLGGNDTICGGGGSDVIVGGGGRDELAGDSGADTIDGGPKGDVIYGNLGDDPLLDGDDGVDQILGGPGKDGIDGGAGSDLFLEGQAGNDRILGGAGGDDPGGGNGSDFINGEAGNDTMEGNAGSDTCRGGPGTDRCNGGAPSPADVSSDPDFCARDVERKRDCRSDLYPRRFELSTTGSANHSENIFESWEGTVVLRRSFQYSTGASYSLADSSGVVTWRIAGNDGTCTYEGEAQVAIRGELAMNAELGTYAGRIVADYPPKMVTRDCPVGPPTAVEYDPMFFPDISTGTRGYSDGQTVLTGSRAYDGDPNSSGGVYINWQWTFLAG